MLFCMLGRTHDEYNRPHQHACFSSHFPTDRAPRHLFMSSLYATWCSARARAHTHSHTGLL